MKMKKTYCFTLLISALVVPAPPAKADDALDLRVSYNDTAHSTVLLEMNGK